MKSLLRSRSSWRKGAVSPKGALPSKLEDESTPMQRLRAVLRDEEARDMLVAQVGDVRILFVHQVSVFAGEPQQDAATAIAIMERYITSGRIDLTQQETHDLTAAYGNGNKMFWALEAIKTRCMGELSRDQRVAYALSQF